MRGKPRFGRAFALLGAVLLIGLSAVLPFEKAGAVGVLVQHTKTTVTGAANVSKKYASTPAANDLLVIICGASGAITITAPSGFSAVSASSIQNPSNDSQNMFYKVAAGTESSALACGGGTSSTHWTMVLFDYSNMVTSSPLDKTATTIGTSAAPATGTTATTTQADELLIGAVTSLTSTAVSGWTGSFVQQENPTITSTPKLSTAGAVKIVSAAGTYSASAATGDSSAAWVGQIAAFKEKTPVSLSADLVDGSGNSIASPAVSMGAASVGFACQSSAGTLGTSSQKVRVSNYTGNPAWTLSLAATGGSSALWTSGGNTYDFNASTGSGCTNGQLTVNPAAGTLTPATGCVSTGVSLGGSSAFVSGTTNSITVASASSSAGYNCYWDITGITLSQKIPAMQRSGSYTLGMTLTLTAN